MNRHELTFEKEVTGARGLTARARWGRGCGQGETLLDYSALHLILAARRLGVVREREQRRHQVLSCYARSSGPSGLWKLSAASRQVMPPEEAA